MNNLFIRHSLCLFLPLFLVRLALALPTGTESVMGEFSPSQSGKELQITVSDGAILQHLSFDVAADETVRFIQPGTDARVLNRISGEAPSRIDGRLYGNGHVYLMNPAGIVFGEGATVEVGKLHAIAGALADQDFLDGVDRYTSLSGLVENQGSISAGEVVLAGSTLSNSGKILAPDGLVVLVAGSSLELASTSNSISVTLESSPTGPLEMGAGLAVGDLVGQALLQSGVVEASRLELHASAMALSGQTSAKEVNVGNFNTLAQVAGSVDTDVLSLEGGSGSTDAPTVDMPSASNRIADLRPSGTFEKLAVRGSSTMLLSASAFNAQAVDLRVYQGDLRLIRSVSPYSQDSESSLLLAAEGNIEVGFDLDNLNFLQKIFYGRNLTGYAYAEVKLESAGVTILDVSSSGIDDLSTTLTPSLLRSLAMDNPSSPDFLFSEYVSESSQASSLAPASPPSFEPVSTPSTSPVSAPGSPPGGSPTAGLLGAPDEVLNLSSVSDARLQSFIDLGFFNQYSYFLQVSSTEAAFLRALEEAGGVSSLFGGSYAVLEEDSGASSADDGESSAEEGGDSSDDGEAGGGEVGADSTSVALKAAAAVPFAPISMPILSPDANRLLDAALSEQVEAGLQKYLNAALPVRGQDAPLSAASNAFVREAEGVVQLYDPRRRAFVPAVPGFVVDRPMLFVTSADSSLVFSGVSGIAGRISGNSRVVLGPAEGGTYEANLRRGTMSVLLDPDRPAGGLGFAVRTTQGVTSAVGTFFAVTEYKGQTYGKVKKGTVKRKVVPPRQADFAAYLSKSKSKPKPKPPQKK